MYPRDFKYPKDINIEYLESWQKEIVGSFIFKDHGVWSDKCAYSSMKDHRWVYDKAIVAQTFEQNTTYSIEDSKEIDNYPVVVKARKSIDCFYDKIKVCRSFKELWEDVSKRESRSYIIQDYFSGNHSIFQCAILGRRVIDSCCFSVIKTSYGSIKCLESMPPDSRPVLDQKKRVDEICSFLNIDRGFVTIEMIGDRVVDIRMRPRIHLFNVCGGIIQHYPVMMRTGKWKKSKYEKSYSRVYRLREDCFASASNIPDPPQGVLSVHMMFENDKKLSSYEQDGRSFKLFIVNGTSIEKIEDFSVEVLKCIDFYNRNK